MSFMKMKNECEHFIAKDQCVFCDERHHIILMCDKCETNTWHAAFGDYFICRRCDLIRDGIGKGDIGISNE